MRTAAGRAADAGSLDPVALFLQHLAAHGFEVGTRELINAHTLWVALAARRELPAALHERLALLRPLLCRTPRQQQDYPQLLARWSPPAQAAAAPHGWRARRRVRPAEGKVPAARWWALGLLLAGAVVVFSWWPVTDRVPRVAPPDAAASEPARPASAPDLPVGDAPGPLPTDQAADPRRADAVAWLDHTGWIAAALFAAMALAVALRRAALQPLRTDLPLEQRALFGEQVELVPRGAPLLRLVSRELRRPRHTERLDLDIPQTIAATVRDGGVFTARHRPRRGTPEYIVLIERRGPHDQLARLAEEIVGVLVRQGVAVDVHRYAGDPSSCEPARLDVHGRVQPDPAKRRLRLAELLSRSGGQRLMLFGDAAGLLDPVGGGLREGLGALPAFGASVLFTPLPVPSWGEAEQSLAQRGLLVLPLQLLALASAADWLVSQRALLSLDPDWPATYPPRLRQDSLRWVARGDAPPPEEVEALLFELQLYLGFERMQWLCACAAFPVPSWTLTVALQPLFIGGGRDAVAGAVALAALPWFREGRWPLWLRDALQQRLAAPHREAVSREIQQRLHAAALGRTAAPGKERLAEVATEPGLAARLRRAWDRFATRQWLRRTGGGLRRDVLFLGFLQRGVAERLMLKVPERLRRLLFREGLPLMGVQAWVPAAMLLVVAGGLVLQAAPVRSWVEARLGEEPSMPGVPRVATLETGTPVYLAGFSPDGQLIAAASGTRVAVWRRDGRPLAQLDLGRTVDFIAFRADGGTLLLRTDGGWTRWGRDGSLAGLSGRPVDMEPVPRDRHAATLQRLEREAPADLREALRTRRAAGFSKDGEWLYTVGADGTVRIWSVDGTQRAAIGDAAADAEFAPSGRQILTFGAPGTTVRLWGERLAADESATWSNAATQAPASPPPSSAPAVPTLLATPDFIGQDANLLTRNAAAWKRRGFELALRQEAAPDFCRGVVVGQTPARGTQLPTGQAVQLAVAQNDTPFYPLLCRGGPRDVKRSAAAGGEFTRLEFDFVAGTDPAARGLLPGQCSWIDRGFRPGEPTRLQVDLNAAAQRALRPLLTATTGFVRFTAVNRGKLMRAGCGEPERQPPPSLAPDSPQQQGAAETPAVELADRVDDYFGRSRSPAVMRTNLNGSLALMRLLARRGMSQPDVLALGLAVVKSQTGGFTLREEKSTAAKSSSSRNQTLRNTEPGDDERFTGRGYQQITGRANYARYSELVYGDSRLTVQPEMLNVMSTALEVLAYDVQRWTLGSKEAPSGWADNAARALGGRAQAALLQKELDAALPLARALMAERAQEATAK